MFPFSLLPRTTKECCSSPCSMDLGLAKLLPASAQSEICCWLVLGCMQYKEIAELQCWIKSQMESWRCSDTRYVLQPAVGPPDHGSCSVRVYAGGYGPTEQRQVQVLERWRADRPRDLIITALHLTHPSTLSCPLLLPFDACVQDLRALVMCFWFMAATESFSPHHGLRDWLPVNSLCLGSVAVN